MLVATMLALVIHAVRVRGLQRMESLRMQDHVRKERLEVALLVVRLHEEEIRQFNEQLEQRVIERTAELRTSEERNRTLYNELNHVARVTTMGEMAASIAHEVNQPLCAIINNAAYCHRWLEKPSTELSRVAEVRDAITDIAESGRRASEVIERIRTMLRKGETEPASFEINEIIHQVVTLMRNEALKRSVCMVIELTADLPLVLGDRVQLQQVILNLIINGFDAMNEVEPAKRELRIRSSLTESGALLVEVSDSGIGIDQSASELIFDAFYTTKAHGLGMGLSICQTIVRTHGGRLWAVNNDVAGATFQFTLPVLGEAHDD
ncbi:MAG: sensor histidine kinase [Blastocatellia bacterium]